MGIEKNKIIDKEEQDSEQVINQNEAKEEVEEKIKISRSMKIKNTIRKYTTDLTNVQFMKLEAASQKGQVTKLRKEVHRVQHLVKRVCLL